MTIGYSTVVYSHLFYFALLWMNLVILVNTTFYVKYEYEYECSR